MSMRKIIAVLIYTIIILIIGRNLPFLPRLSFIASEESEIGRLETQIKRIASVSKGSYSVYFEDYKTNASFSINAKTVHTGASVNKLPIIAVLYSLANKGTVNLDEKVTIQEDDIQDYGTGSIRYKEGAQEYSLRTLSKLALKESDNTAAHVIGKKIGTDVVQKTLEQWGLSQTDMANNKTTVADMALLFKKIYNKELINAPARDELLEFLNDTTIEDRLPPLLPKDARIYHKTGDAVGGAHDLGIIEKDGMVFFLGVMTSDIGNSEEQTKKTIAEIAKKTYEFVLSHQ